MCTFIDLDTITVSFIKLYNTDFIFQETWFITGLHFSLAFQFSSFNPVVVQSLVINQLWEAPKKELYHCGSVFSNLFRVQVCIDANPVIWVYRCCVGIRCLGSSDHSLIAKKSTGGWLSIVYLRTVDLLDVGVNSLRQSRFNNTLQVTVLWH